MIGVTAATRKPTNVETISVTVAVVPVSQHRDGDPRRPR